MTGVASTSFVAPTFNDPTSFAEAVASGAYDSTQLGWTESVFESRGLGDLANLLQRVREGRVRAADVVKVRRAIERLARQKETKVRKALASAPWSAPWPDRKRPSPQTSRFASLDPAMVAAFLANSQPARPRVAEVPSIVETMAMGQDPRLTPPPPRSRPVTGASTTPAGTVGIIETVDDDDLFPETDFLNEVLPLVLREVGERRDTPLESALATLKSRSAFVPVQVIALRVIGDHLKPTLAGWDDLPRILDAIEKILDSHGPSSRLREMASVLLLHVRNKLSETTISQELQDRITSLSKFIAFDSSSTQFELERPTPRDDFERVLFQWHSVWPPWYAILGEILAIQGSDETKVEQARALFSSPHEAFFRRALSLAYYDYLISSHRGFYLTRKEADSGLEQLLYILRNNNEPFVLKEMAVSTYEGIITNLFNETTHKVIAGDEAPRVEWALWAVAKSTLLAEIVGPSHPVVRIIEGLAAAFVIKAPARSDPPTGAVALAESGSDLPVPASVTPHRISSLRIIPSPEDIMWGTNEWFVAFRNVLASVLPGDERNLGERAWLALKDQNESLAVKVVILRVFGSQLYDQETIEGFLDSVETLTDILLDSRANLWLKAMAYSVLTSDASVNDFFMKASDWLEGRRQAMIASNPPQLPGARLRGRRGQIVSLEMFEPHRERILQLAENLNQIFRTAFTKELFDVPEESWPKTSELFDFPPWPAVLPEWLGIRGDEISLAQQAHQIFADDQQPNWRRTVALAYFGFLTFGDKGVVLDLPQMENILNNLTAMMVAAPETESPLVNMSLRAFQNVLANQRRDVRNRQGIKPELVLEVDRYALLQIKQLKKALDTGFDSRSAYVSNSLAPLETELKASIRELDPPRWLRFMRWLSR